MTFEHFDFRPLVLARFHSLGSKTQILNDAFRAQYDQVLEKLTYQPKLEPMDRLSMVYYLLLQNRIDEAMTMFQQVDRLHWRKTNREPRCKSIIWRLIWRF